MNQGKPLSTFLIPQHFSRGWPGGKRSIIHYLAGKDL